MSLLNYSFIVYQYVGKYGGLMKILRLSDNQTLQKRTF